MRKVLTTICMDTEQLARLNGLSAITRVPKTVYVQYSSIYGHGAKKEIRKILTSLCNW